MPRPTPISPAANPISTTDPIISAPHSLNRLHPHQAGSVLSVLLVLLGIGLLLAAGYFVLNRGGMSGTRGPVVTSVASAVPSVRRPPESVLLFGPGRDELDAFFAWDGDGAGGENGVGDGDADWIADGKVLSPGEANRGLLTRQTFGGYMLHVDFKVAQGAEEGGGDGDKANSAGVYLNGTHHVALDGRINGMIEPSTVAAEPTGEWQSLEIAYEDPEDSGNGAANEGPIVSVWLNGERVHDEVRLGATSESGAAGDGGHALYVAEQDIALGVENVTVLARFIADAGGNGSIFSKSPSQGDWQPDAKAVFFRGEQLVYDIGWVGAVNIGKGFNDGEEHTLAYVYRDRVIHLYVDGELKATRENFISDDNPEHVFKIGAASPNFGGDLEGNVSKLLVFERAVSEDEIKAFATGEQIEDEPALEWQSSDNGRNNEENGEVRPTPDLNFESVGKLGPIGIKAGMEGGGDVSFANIWIAPLTEVNHAELIAGLDDAALLRGQRLYDQVCVACHGTINQEGTLPTARQFHKQAFEAGTDPFRMYKTLDRGYKQMLPQVWMNPQQKYDVIHYIRESVVKEHNAAQYFEVTDEYVATLPRGRSSLTAVTVAEGKPDDSYKQMNFGPSFNWTLEVEPGNIAYKGIAVRLDKEGDLIEGGVSAGRQWALYDHDTMRMAAMWEKEDGGGRFVDWRGIAFDGSHGTHTKIVGETVYVNPVGPGWAKPGTNDFTDPRFLGRDGKPYGPLPREWAHFKGIYKHGDKVIISYTVGTTSVLEHASLVADGVMVRTIEVSDPEQPLAMRVAPVGVPVALSADSFYALQEQDGFTILSIPASSGAKTFQIFVGGASNDAVAAIRDASQSPIDLQPLLAGGEQRWPDVLAVRGELDVAKDWDAAPNVTQTGVTGSTSRPYVVDSLFVPRDNPWNAWMRLGGFDFYPGGKQAIVCTWNGDVWLVSGIDESLELLTWQRIAAGLFQPLGVKIVDDTIYVICRDQIVRLHDLNGDNEIDFFENFNNDHQVTEHFHEFAMGLDTDADGNFYYAKGARHAKTALVPQHGTLLRVSPDGSTTEIVANGFRAPNGVCINGDGTFFVTDQEGHWTPKNRINLVEEGKFYGNYMGFHDKTNSDSEMEQPVVWLTNSFDRSPAELLWAKTDRWGPLGDQLIAVSYGMGQVFAVPYETVDGQMQGGQTPFPLPLFPTGIMRGKFSDQDGQLYVAGMFAWAGNRVEPGGFYRVRYTGEEVIIPVGIHAGVATFELTFSEDLDPVDVARIENYEIRAWDLTRSSNYGSQHHNERSLQITRAELLPDGRTIRMTVPDLAPTWGMKCVYTVRSAMGVEVSSEIHNTVHAISSSPTGQ